MSKYFRLKPKILAIVPVKLSLGCFFPIIILLCQWSLLKYFVEILCSCIAPFNNITSHLRKPKTSGFTKAKKKNTSHKRKSKSAACDEQGLLFHEICRTNLLIFCIKYILTTMETFFLEFSHKMLRRIILNHRIRMDAECKTDHQLNSTYSSIWMFLIFDTGQIF